MRAMPIELSVDRDPLSHFLLSPRMYVAGLTASGASDILLVEEVHLLLLHAQLPPSALPVDLPMRWTSTVKPLCRPNAAWSARRNQPPGCRARAALAPYTDRHMRSGPCAAFAARIAFGPRVPVYEWAAHLLHQLALVKSASSQNDKDASSRWHISAVLCMALSCPRH